MKDNQKRVVKQNKEDRKPTKITNHYQNISTEERIRLYLKICRYVVNGEEM